MSTRYLFLFVMFVVGLFSCAAPRRPNPEADGAPLQAGLRNAQERRFFRKVSEHLGSTIALVAAHPEASYPAGTLAAEVKEAFLGFDESARKRKSQAARKVLAENADARRGRFGAFADRDLAALQSGTIPVLDTEMKAQLRKLVDARWDDFTAEFAEIQKAAQSSLDYSKLPQTWVEGGVFQESDEGGRSLITIHQPELFGFRWRTDEMKAFSGFWELRQMKSGLLPERVLATGQAPDDATKPGVQGFFEIDLKKHLPATPPIGSGVYHVRVMPMPKAGMAAQKTRDGLTAAGGMQATSVLPPDPDGVGPWSAPVVIQYGESKTPPQAFTEVYRKARFHLSSIEMIEDQVGPGSEEFHVAGFVQPHTPNGPGQGRRFGPYFAKLHPDGPRRHEFDKEIAFGIPSGSADWPRVFTVVISVIETDDGESYSKWVESVWRIANAAISEEVDAAIRERLSELREKMLKEVSEEAFEQAIEVFEASTTSDFASAWVKMIATLIIGAIEGGLPDDYYGTEAISFVMLGNQASLVENEGAFLVVHKGSSKILGGRIVDGNFHVKAKSIRFYGQPSYPDAGSFDGKVDITLRWVLEDRGL